MSDRRCTNNRRRRQQIFLLSSLVLCAVLSGLPPSAQNCRAQSQIVIYETRDVDGFDPFTYRGTESYRLMGLLFAPMLEATAKSGEYNYRTASSIEKNGLSWTIRLRKDMFFANGYQSPGIHYDTVTAQDVVASYKAFLDKRTNLNDPYYRTQLPKYVEELRAVGTQTIAVKFRKGVSPNPDPLTFPVVPAKLLPLGYTDRSLDPATKKQRECVLHPYGAGYYFVKGEPRTDRWDLRKNERLPDTGDGHRAHIDRIFFQVSKNYDSDFNSLRDGNYLYAVCVPDVPSEKIGEFSQNQYQRLQDLVALRYNYVAFNVTRPILSDRLVRRALSCAIDREKLLGHIQHQGKSITGPFPVDDPFRCDTCSAQYQQYDPSLATRLLDQAGWKKGTSRWREKGGATLAIKLIVAAEVNSIGSEIANVIKGFWEDAGVRATVDCLSWPEFGQRVRRDRDFDAAYGSWSFSFRSDPEPIFRSAGTANFVSYSSKVVDSLLDVIPSLTTDDKFPVYHRIQQVIADDAPYAFLYTLRRCALISKSPVAIDVGPNWDPWNFFRRINEWTIQ